MIAGEVRVFEHQRGDQMLLPQSANGFLVPLVRIGIGPENRRPPFVLYHKMAGGIVQLQPQNGGFGN
ncbi:hypothetical protein D3C76_1304440 [compost metagenome]